MPSISLIMPTKNRAHLLPETLESILAQTYTDWELIIVDDHGTDNTEELIQKLNDPRIRYYKLPSGGGPGRGRAYGIEQARSDFLAFCDSDDLNKPHRIELEIAKLQEGVEVVYSDIEVINTLSNERWVRPSQDFSQELLRNINFIPTPTVAMRKDVYVRSGGFDENLMTSEDYDLWQKLSRINARFLYINQPLILMRIHSENTTKSVQKEQRKTNLRLVRQRYNLPVPSYDETMKLIDNEDLRRIFSTDHQKDFWFSESK